MGQEITCHTHSMIQKAHNVSLIPGLLDDTKQNHNFIYVNVFLTFSLKQNLGLDIV